MKTKKLFISFIVIGLTITSQSANAQNLSQTVRGNIFDENTHIPLVGVIVEARSGESKFGAISDENGDFRLNDLPIGRYNIQYAMLGYETKRLYQLEVTSSKEVVLNIALKEEITATNTVVVTARKDKSKTINQSIKVSGRTFSIEESQRYAGSRGDVARMAQNFAGVQGADDSRNDIIVRGNSPTGVLYRLEGVDIPNPNHFSSAGTTGGPISMLNNNVLENSDFISGAFPAEYGNATAAVFDIGLRKGNDEKFEFLGQMGFAGFELMAEGPLSEKNKASFLVNYRYSALGVFSLLGFEFGTGTAIPNYQDLSFHLHFPGKKGNTKVFGLGGLSDIKLFQSEQDPENDNLYADDVEDLKYSTNTGVVGISRFQQLSKNTFAKITVAIDAAQTKTHLDTFAYDENNNIINYAGFFRDNSTQGKHSLAAMVQHRFSARNTLKGGFRWNHHFFSLSDSFYNTDRNVITGEPFGWVEPNKFDGKTSLVQTYVNDVFRINKKLTTTAGINTSYFTFNGSFSVEPRLAFSYQVNPRYTINGGYGLHSQVPPFRIYFEDRIDSTGRVFNANKDIGFTKSHHLILGNDFRLGKNTRLKIEGYYQSLFDVPIDANNDTFYSLLNEGADFGVAIRDSMMNARKGKNFGVEITFERFLSRGIYFLNTLSLYRSLYEDKAGNMHPIAFDSRYALNMLGGKEFYFKQKMDKKSRIAKGSLTTDIKFTMNGGRRFTPVDVEKSWELAEVVLDNSQRNGEQHKDYIRFDLRIAYKVQKPKFTQEWGIDIQNLTNQKNIFNRVYNPTTNEWRTTYQTGLFPIGLYRITF